VQHLAVHFVDFGLCLRLLFLFVHYTPIILPIDQKMATYALSSVSRRAALTSSFRVQVGESAAASQSAELLNQIWIVYL
jgi:hypothetical protein